MHCCIESAPASAHSFQVEGSSPPNAVLIQLCGPDDFTELRERLTGGKQAILDRFGDESKPSCKLECERGRLHRLCLWHHFCRWPLSGTRSVRRAFVCI